MTSPQSTDKAATASKLLPLSDAVQHALAVTKRGVDELLIESEFAQKLARSEQSGKPLRIKLGLDPTAPDLHLFRNDLNKNTNIGCKTVLPKQSGKF